MNKVKRVLNRLKKKEQNIKLFNWMIRVTRPYIHYIIIIFIISLVSMGISYASTIIGKYVVDDATKGAINIGNITLMCVTTIVSIIIGIFSSILSSYINERFSFNIKQKLFNDIQRSVWIKISKYHSGDLVTRLTSDVGGLADGLISLIPSTILIVCQLVISFCILFHYDKTIAVLALILGPMGALSMIFFKERYKKYQKQLRESESEYRTFMQESLSDLTVIKTFMQEDINEKKMEEFKNKRLKLVIRNTRLSSIMGAVMKMIYNVGYVIAFCWGSYRISTGDITYGTLTVFITLVSKIQGSVSGLAGLIPQVYSMLISAERISDVTEMEKEIYEGKTSTPKKVGLEIKGVSFAYDKEQILKNLDLSVKPGEKIGIVGASGAGKTTLIRMLLALTKPQKGSIEYTFSNGGEPVCPDSRRFISYVPQGNTLKTGTIAENIRVGKSDANEVMIKKSLKMASANKFVEKFPEKLETEIGEGSVGISEGQAQRIAIARALISEKPVLILDEATSALDEKTESIILKNITENLTSITCFIITHRSSMLKYCDKVIEIDENGNISMRIVNSFSSNI